MGDRVCIVGIRTVDFKDSQSGKPVTGFSFYYTMEENNSKLEGVSCGKIFVSSEYFSKLSYVPSVGQECFVYYNRFGKLSSFAPI